MLRDLPLKLTYRTGRNDFAQDFFIPCLKQAVSYRRAVGYFSSAGIARITEGILGLVANGGVMQLVTSPKLNEQDIETINAGYRDAVEVCKDSVVRDLEEVKNAVESERLNIVYWLAKFGILQIRLALRTDASGKMFHGIYHEKIGIITDNLGDSVSFIGSGNETDGGFFGNYESLKVFASWKDIEGRVSEDLAYFEELWSNDAPEVHVIDFSEIASELFEKYKTTDTAPFPVPQELIKKKTSTKKLRPYQIDAINSWASANGKGIFAMATGSGKTFTAISLAQRVAQKNKPLIVLVLCPFIALVKQWSNEVKKSNMNCITCCEGVDTWSHILESSVQSVFIGSSEILYIIATNATFLGKQFQHHLKRFSSNKFPYWLIIADEVHNLGAERALECMPEWITLRLGLSATPERHCDPIGTSQILNYFGDVVFEFTLADALKHGYLCPYYYHPILVELTEDEFEEYCILTKQIARLIHSSSDEVSTATLSALLKRSKLLSLADNKISALSSVLHEISPLRKAIFYCGEGKKSMQKNEQSQLNLVKQTISNIHELHVRTFTHETPPDERMEILKQIETGVLDGIVAMRCLDEGIDVPDLEYGFFLASTSNPRQFIQRRGRLLRTSENKKCAHIYDFIASPPSTKSIDSEDFLIERSLVKKELSRVFEFCRHAQNCDTALKKLQEIRTRYLLFDA